MTIGLSPESKEELVKQALERGLSLTGFMEYLARAFAEGSVFIIEGPTYHNVMEYEIKPQLYRWMRKMVWQEMELVFIENGFMTKMKKPH